MQADLRVDASRLAASIGELARIGAVEGGGVCRTAASDEDRLASYLDGIAEREGVRVARSSLARFDPVVFDARIVAIIEARARWATRHGG